MKIWILGGQGFVGRALQAACMKHRIAWVASSKEEADVTNIDRLLKVGDCVRPTHIINCAAITDIDYAQKNVEKAFLVNSIGAKHAALAAVELGAHLIHLSTDYVFDGLSDRPYKEEDPCRALSIYGQSKLGGEQLVRETMPEACIIRTSWVFGPGEKNPLGLLIKRLKNEETIEVPIDELRSPTYVDDLAENILDMLAKSGTYHFANKGVISRYQIVCDLREALIQHYHEIKCTEVKPISQSTLLGRVPRPAYSALDTEQIEKVLGRETRAWPQVLQEFVRAL